ncbi:membrane protein [Beggiatoa sp. PS]|nr:membrane protein [Beggiatoa sp. PS]
MQLSETINFCGWTIVPKDRWGINDQRITYRISWANLIFDEANNPVLTVLPAQPYTELPLEESTEALTDSIVILGKSYNEGYDIYSTSLKDMPGALIIVNAIHSLLQPEKIKLPIGVRLFIITLFIVLLSIFLNKFSSYKSVLVFSIFIIFMLLPLTMIFFHGGVWFNLALPLIGIIFVRIIFKYQVNLLKKLYLK